MIKIFSIKEIINASKNILNTPLKNKNRKLISSYNEINKTNNYENKNLNISEILILKSETKQNKLNVEKIKNNETKELLKKSNKNLLWHYRNHRRSVEKQVHECLKVGGGCGERAFLGNTLCLPIRESHRDNINSWQVLFYILCNIYCIWKTNI